MKSFALIAGITVGPPDSVPPHANRVGVVLLVLWLLGFFLLKKAIGGIIHILLIIAVIAILIHFLGAGGRVIS